MLKHIHPLFSADLLYSLQSMGHGDTLAIVDANFPATSNSQFTHISMLGTDCSQMLEAILKHVPLDAFTPTPVRIMAQDNSEQPTDAAQDFIKTVEQSEESENNHLFLERNEFYKKSKECQLIISTSDLRPYACVILQKGVIFD